MRNYIARWRRRLHAATQQQSPAQAKRGISAPQIREITPNDRRRRSDLLQTQHFWSDRCPAEIHGNPVFKSPRSTTTVRTSYAGDLLEHRDGVRRGAAQGRRSHQALGQLPQEGQGSRSDSPHRRRQRQQAERLVRRAHHAALLRDRRQGRAGVRGRARRRPARQQGRRGQDVRARRCGCSAGRQAGRGQRDAALRLRRQAQVTFPCGRSKRTRVR